MAILDIAFPFQRGSDGTPAGASDEEVTAQMLEILINTAPGEIPGFPEWGINAWKYTFEHNTIGLASLIHGEVADGVARFLPQLDIRAVIPRFDPTDPTSQSLEVIYVDRGKQQSLTVTGSGA